MLAVLLAESTKDFPTYWIVIGFLGQGIFGARMVVQWIATEKARESVIPVAFWYMSIIGAAITLAYAIKREDPVFITAQAGGLLVYLRNMYFILQKQKATGPATDFD